MSWQDWGDVRKAHDLPGFTWHDGDVAKKYVEDHPKKFKKVKGGGSTPTRKRLTGKEKREADKILQEGKPKRKK